MEIKDPQGINDEHIYCKAWDLFWSLLGWASTGYCEENEGKSILFRFICDHYLHELLKISWFLFFIPMNKKIVSSSNSKCHVPWCITSNTFLSLRA